MAEMEDADEDVCGYSYDHETDEVYNGPDGYQWVCRRCGAEGWEDADEVSAPSGSAAE